jgi:simple sugar transport system permease protein
MKGRIEAGDDTTSTRLRMRVALTVVALLLTLSGTVLYLASYFWGGWLLAAAVLVVVVRLLSVRGREAGIAWLKAVLTRALIPVIGIGCALAIGAIIMLSTGYDPAASYAALFYGGLVRNWSVSVLNAVPLIFTGLAIAFAFQGGLFNIGAEGQYYIGVIAATWLGLRLDLPPQLGIPLIFLVGMVFGAALNAIPAVLKVRTGAHEVVTTMMFAYAMKTVAPIFIRANGGDPTHSSHPLTTDQISDKLFLPLFKTFLPNANYRLHVGILLAIVTALVVQFILKRTNLGYKIRAVGCNPVAARTQGISVAWITIASLLISGAIAGMAGVTQVLGLDHRMYGDLNAGYGWNGISIALLARNNPVAIVFTSILWGVLDAGGQYMARTAHTPNAIIEIIKSIILFLMLAETIYEYFGSKISAWRSFRRLQRKGGRS